MTLLLAVLLAATPVRAQGTDDERWDARLTAVTGEVTVRPGDGSEETPGAAGMPLEQGDRVVTGAGAEAELALDDGSVITVREGSDFKLEDTRKAKSSFTLSFGTLLAKIQKLGSQELTVRTPTAVAAVRGTEFGVEASGDQSHFGVFDEGRVEVEGSGGKEVLTPNQETSVARGARPLKAFALKRFVMHRGKMKAQVRRLKTIRKNWKRLPPEQRRAARAQAFSRMRDLRKKLREERREQRRERRREPPRRRGAPR